MKLLTYLISLTALALIWSCTEDPYVQEPEANPILKFELTGKDSIRSRFAINKKYLLTLKLKNEYTDYDSIKVNAIYKTANNNQTVTDTIIFRNDGISPDLIPNNEIWSAYFIPGIDNSNNTIADSLIFTAQLYKDNRITNAISRKDINCRNSIAPVLQSITGLAAGTVLESGFEPFNVIIKAVDENNMGSYSDNLTAFIAVYDSTGLIKRTDSSTNYIYDSTKFNFRLDSSFAAGLKTGSQYKIRTYIRDSFGDLSDTLRISGLKIKNSAPILSEFVCPDSVKKPAAGQTQSNYLITVKVYDDQGSKNDIDSVRATFTNSITLKTGILKFYDDGDPIHGDTQVNDGKYSQIFKLIPESPVVKYYIEVVAYDKANNRSISILDSVKVVPASRAKFKGKK